MMFTDTDIWQPNETLPLGHEIRLLKKYKHSIIKKMNSEEKKNELSNELKEIDEKLDRLKEQYCLKNFNKSNKEYTDEMYKLKFASIKNNLGNFMDKL